MREDFDLTELDLEEMEDKSYELLVSMNETQKAVVEAIDEVYDTIPRGFFQENNVEELNEHFGGHDDMVVDDMIRFYYILCQAVDDEWDEMIDLLNDLPDEEEDDSSDAVNEEEKFRENFIKEHGFDPDEKRFEWHGLMMNWDNYCDAKKAEEVMSKDPRQKKVYDEYIADIEASRAEYEKYKELGYDVTLEDVLDGWLPEDGKY